MEKRSKVELIEFVVGIALADRTVRKEVQAQFDLEMSVRELIATTRIAIGLATSFDDRDLNSNFDYDDDAYETVEKNFARLIKMGEQVAVMEMAVELMRQGSKQVECSDEGMMTAEIKACLGVVIKALKKGVVPASDVVAWCDQMTHADRVGFICADEIRALRRGFARD